ncbi:MAG: hypothetical protein AABX38_07915 [Candidatus Micrarchaeota archaeon]
MFTTSRYCSKSTKELAKQLSSIFNTVYISRTKKSIDELASYSRKVGEHRICIVKENKENIPAFIEFITIDELGKWSWIDGQIKLAKEVDNS